MTNDQYAEISDLYKGRKPAEVIPLLEELAGQGHVVAQLSLGSCYDNGFGVTHDEEKAIYWYTKAAEQGNVKAQQLLAYCYYNGSVEIRDYVKAAEWFRKAAEQGDEYSQKILDEFKSGGKVIKALEHLGSALLGWKEYEKAEKTYLQILALDDNNSSARENLALVNLGLNRPEKMTPKSETKTMNYGDKQYYIALRGIVENKEDGWEDCAKELRESFEAAQKAAESNNAAGQYNLAMHYDYDFGVEGTEEEAFKWYEKAAMQGHSDAMHSLAWCYKRGCGTAPDSEKYFEWQKKAAFAYYAEGIIDSAVHAVDCLADYPADAEVIALLSQMRNDPRVQQYAAKRYPSTPAFLDDLEKRLTLAYLKHDDNDVKYETSVNYTIHGQFSVGELALRAHSRLFDWDMYVYRLPYSPRWLPAREDKLTREILENYFPLKAGDTGPAGGIIIKCDKILRIADDTGEHGYRCVEAAPFDAGYASWQDAQRLCEEFSLNGVSGWRLPTVNDLREFAAALRARLRAQNIQQTTETVINWSSARGGETAAAIVTQENEDFYQYLYHYPMGGTSGGFYKSKSGPHRGGKQEFPVTHRFAVRPVRYFYAKNIVLEN